MEKTSKEATGIFEMDFFIIKEKRDIPRLFLLTSDNLFLFWH
jgi:hypothetical protein